MDSEDAGGEGQTFRVNFSSEGVEKLRDRVKEKLKEYMGEYTDDTLVEYVIVLLKNGRRKDEARNELNVFLDDDSDSFVSWLWDHLGSKLNLYVQARESHSDEVAKTKPVTAEQSGRSDSHQLEFESEKVNPNKSSRSGHTREWKGLVRDAVEHPPLQSSVVDSTHAEKESHCKVGQEKQSVSPRPVAKRKRSRPEERAREVVSQATAPRRLLQFAVRDAVATSRPPNATTEPSLKHLRSVVSTSTLDSNVEEHPKRIRSVARVPSDMAAAIKAVAEAAKDVRKVRSSGNVFDRLGRASNVSDTLKQSTEYEDNAVDAGEDENYSNIREQARSTYDQRDDYSRLYIRNVSMLQSDARMAIDPASNDEDYNVNELRQGFVDVSQTGTSGDYRGEDLLMLQGRVADNADEMVHKLWKDQDQTGHTSNTSHKTVNTSVNLNTWKLPKYQESRQRLEVDSRKRSLVSEQVPAKSGMQAMKDNNNPIAAANGNAKVEVDLQKESQKTQSSAPGIYPTGRPAEDADSRTIFVNNVHFAAAKDSLSRHFNKFGEVLKVIILTDAATGQPKGSAYVEFTRKEAAENALSLDGTSFMSRILRVVRKSSAQLEASSIMTWPRIARGSPFSVPRFGRVAFPRGIAGSYRARLPIKPGARSFQWKRDSQSTPAEMPSLTSSNFTPSSIPRSLTYVRNESKTNGSSGAT